MTDAAAAAEPRSRLAHDAAPAAVFVVALVAYLRTLMPGMAFDDWGEMQTVPHVLGIAHPTGYPTYLITGWLFGLLPIGSVAFRANLLSAVCVALALAAATSVQQRLGVRPVIAAVASLATGAVAIVWVSANVAEVNPLHLRYIALILDRPLGGADGRRLRDLALGGLLIGLSLGNHALTAFVAPYLVLYVLWSGRTTLREHPLWLLAPVATLLAGLSVYLYIPIAASLKPPLVYNNPVTWEGFRFLVSGEQFRGQYGGLLTPDGPRAFLASLPDLWMLLVAEGSAALALLGLAGLVATAFRRPAFAVTLAAIQVTGLYVWANYLRLEHYLLVPWLVLGILAGVALDTAANLLGRATAGHLRGAHVAAAVAVGAAITAILVVSNLPAVDRSDDRSAQTYVEEVLASLPPDAAILTYWGASTPLWHATLVEGRRPDVLVVDDTNIVYEGWGTRENRIRSLVCSRPVFILRLGEGDLVPTRREYRLTEVARPVVSWGGPTGTSAQPLYRVEPLAGCP
jgi:hypothetical protein